MSLRSLCSSAYAWMGRQQVDKQIKNWKLYNKYDSIKYMIKTSKWWADATLGVNPFTLWTHRVFFPAHEKEYSVNQLAMLKCRFSNQARKEWMFMAYQNEGHQPVCMLWWSLGKDENYNYHEYEDLRASTTNQNQMGKFKKWSQKET